MDGPLNLRIAKNFALFKNLSIFAFLEKDFFLNLLRAARVQLNLTFAQFLARLPRAFAGHTYNSLPRDGCAE